MGTCPDAVKRLIERFNQQSDQVRSPDYNETQLRIDFINPLFAQLGWDMDNTQGYAEQYREVVHEDRVKVAGATKAPDYSFRIGGARKFFLEAKKPFVNIKQAWEPAYQLRRYAWSAKLAVSLLTDFEELAIYDARVAPRQLEKASVARRELIPYTDYPERWNFIDGTFSKRAVLTGEFDRYCATKKGRGAQEFDTAFLVEIEQWRKTLASNLALRNERLDERDLNFATQRIIDRIIFLRICEDRGVEPVGHLQQLLSGDHTYQRLVRLFHEADARYNSGLFHFRKEAGRDESPDELTLTLDVDDDKLKSILKRLYYPESPYEFAVVSADILGSVYERFLGSVIELTPGHRVKIEPKPEVRKAGGVYYTPTYIVDYIVKQTVGKLLGTADSADSTDTNSIKSSAQSASSAVSMSPSQAAKLKILDPACGSGSFLLGAYQFLLDWHLKWYVNDGPEKWSKGKTATIRPADRAAVAASLLPPTPAGASDQSQIANQKSQIPQHLALTTSERKRILLDNIHGVDIDYQAVEVTKLSLLLRCLEGETAESIRAQMTLFRERALPDLGKNIQCGNSLIGTDILHSASPAGRGRGEGAPKTRSLTEDEIRRINPFDYERAFPQVFKQGGFDAVIGNPPYVRQESIKPSKSYFQSKYASFDSAADLYVYFIERGTSLLRENGLLSFIVSSSFLRTSFGAGLREHIGSRLALLQLIDFGGLAIFEDAKDTYVCIPIIGRRQRTADVAIARLDSLEPPNVEALARERWYTVPAAHVTGREWSLDLPEATSLFQRIKSITIPLGAVVGQRIFLGVKTGMNEAFELDLARRNELVSRDCRSEDLVRAFLGGQNIRRYYAEDEGRYLIGVPCGFTRHRMSVPDGVADGGDEQSAWKWFRKNFPAIAQHLAPFAEKARRRTDQGEFWWELRSCEYYEVLDGPKIIYPDITKSCRFHLDKGGTWIRNTAYCLDSQDPFLLAVLNSRLLWFCVARVSIPFGTRAGEYRYRMFTQYVENLPIVAEVEKKRRDEFARLAESMLSLHAAEAAAAHPQEKEQLRRRIEATDRQIDQLVYQLYGLTDEEIKIVEEATR